MSIVTIAGERYAPRIPPRRPDREGDCFGWFLYLGHYDLDRRLETPVVRCRRCGGTMAMIAGWPHWTHGEK